MHLGFDRLEHALSVLCQSNEELRMADKEVMLVCVASDREKVIIKFLKSFGQENQIDETSDDIECFERVFGILTKDWPIVPFERLDEWE
ncbi:hypothetical protein SUGI_0041680 [Cryptomeria japonica]|nr:hypothetical protein SUGI_0041680 [Cryptomeria japonica]